jgi:hypothetical protein
MKASYRNRRQVQQLNHKGEIIAAFDSVFDASRKTGVRQSSITFVADGKRKGPGKYYWAYVGGQRVWQIRDDKILAKHPNAHEAAKRTGVALNHIIDCAEGKRKTAGSFVWMYEGDAKA